MTRSSAAFLIEILKLDPPVLPVVEGILAFESQSLLLYIYKNDDDNLNEKNQTLLPFKFSLTELDLDETGSPS